MGGYGVAQVKIAHRLESVIFWSLDMAVVPLSVSEIVLTFCHLPSEHL